MYKVIERIFEVLVRYGIIVMECIGVGVILYSGLRACILLLRRKRVDLSLNLAEGIALGLEFLLCGEIMHTVVVREAEELILVGAIVLMRIALTVLIHWEASHEKKAGKESGGNEH